MTRAFIIGNGPSLKYNRMELLANEVTFAMNRIHLLYPTTTWRPTYYVHGESPFEDNQQQLIEELSVAFSLGIPCYLVNSHRGVSHAGLRRFQKPTSVENYFTICEHARFHYDDKQKPKMWHLPEICTFGSTVTTAMQIAVKLGYGPLYLLGCDLGYDDKGINHFNEHYNEGYLRLKEAKYCNGDALEGHKIALKSCPVSVYNCTVGGNLEVYPRKTLDEVLNGEQ